MTQSSELINHRATETPVGRKPRTAVTRVDLIEAVYRRVGLSRTESAKLVELVLKEINDCRVFNDSNCPAMTCKEMVFS